MDFIVVYGDSYFPAFDSLLLLRYTFSIASFVISFDIEKLVFHIKCFNTISSYIILLFLNLSHKYHFTPITYFAMRCKSAILNYIHLFADIMNPINHYFIHNVRYYGINLQEHFRFNYQFKNRSQRVN